MGTIRRMAKRKYQIQRDYDILKARDDGYDTPTMIANALGVTYDVAQHTLQTYRMISDHGDEYEYIDISLELCDLLDEAGCDVDRCATLIMRELWVNGYNTRASIARMADETIEQIIHSHRVHRAGKQATEVFLNWQKSLREAEAKATMKWQKSLKGTEKAKKKKTAK